MRGVLCLTLAGFPAVAQGQASAAISRIESTLASGKKERANGHFATALEYFARAAEAAHGIGNPDLEAKALNSASVCQIHLFQYRAALQSAEIARRLAIKTKDDSVAGAAAGNIATVYAQLGDFSHAKSESENSVELLEHSVRQDFLVTALMNYGSIQISDGDSDGGVHSCLKAVSVAKSNHFRTEEAESWDNLGRAYLDLNRLSEADEALKTAAAQHAAAHDQNSLAITTANRSELEFRRRNFGAALRLIDAAFAIRSSAFASSPQYEPVHLRGKILLALGRHSEALVSFRKAVELAFEWRRGALPGDVTSTRTVSHLHDVFEDCIELAAQLSLERGDSALAEEAWGILAKSRAASLREQMDMALARDGRLPPSYFDLLSKLQAAQAQVTLSQKPSAEANIRKIRLELTSLENDISIGAQNLAPVEEKIPYKKSLRDIRLRLSLSDLLFSFCLGKSKSFLWTITRGQVNLYELPAEDRIGSQAEAFSAAVQAGRDASVPGRALAEQLFGKIKADAWQRSNWLIAADGVLLEGVPFAALPKPPALKSAEFIGGSRTLRFLPSELLLLNRPATDPTRRFVGIADPIYNLADARRTRATRVSSPTRAETRPPTLVLARLVGSDREVRNAAQLSGVPETQLLVGAEATGQALAAALLTKPEVVHFAVHVVSPSGQPGEAALALSLTNQNIPELLTPEAIAAYRVPGSLVVLSGCSSEQGTILPTAGLIGLSRAWLLAGASAVIVSAWPTPDDSGRFFSSFYGHLQLSDSRPGSLVQRAASALQQAQLEMQHSGGYRSPPSFWAAYSMISKE